MGTEVWYNELREAVGEDVLDDLIWGDGWVDGWSWSWGEGWSWIRVNGWDDSWVNGWVNGWSKVNNGWSMSCVDSLSLLLSLDDGSACGDDHMVGVN